jgi:hypothetical protein
MLFRFVRTIIHLAEGMFVVADHVRDDFECLRHGSGPLFIFLKAASSENDASAPPGLRSLAPDNAAITVTEVVPT